jgi:iron complex transport system ATP-binding protein
MQTLSDGERQKIMIAKAVAQETPIILLDEPTAFLDYPSKVAMMLLLHRLSKALHKTIFLSTHDLEHALQVADHIWLIDKEKGLVTGSPEDLSLSGKIEEFFVKDCMRYDPVKQIFDIQYQFVHSFPVVADDKDNSLYILLCKAMSRNGIKATDRQSSDDYFMKVEGSKFCMMKKGSVEKTTSSIEEAVDFINKAIAQIKKSEVVEEEQSVAVESAAVKE